MDNQIRIGIKNSKPEKESIVINTFNIVRKIIKSKKEFIYNIKIEEYKNLEKEFPDEEMIISGIENIKATCEMKKEIILFNDSFFDERCEEIIRNAVFIHEIGHIIGYALGKSPRGASKSFKEYIADKFLFEVSEDIFLKGRLIPDLQGISITKIKEIEDTEKKENCILDFKEKLYYHNKILPCCPIIHKINEEIDEFVESSKELFLGKGYKKELEDSFNEIDKDINYYDENDIIKDNLTLC